MPLLSGEKMLRMAEIAYFAVTLLLLLRVILQTVAVLSLMQKASPTELYGRKVYARKGLPVPFSFLNRIALDLEQYSGHELKEILLHEEAHVRQLHSFDLILSEIICSFSWVNPFVWLLKKEIRINLEYIADHAVLKSGCEATHYQLHLLRLSYTKATATISNNFNVSPLKKRIVMMNRKKTSPAGIWKYALLAPAFAALAFFNSSLRAEIHLPFPVAEATDEATPAEKSVRETPSAATRDTTSGRAEVRFTPPNGSQAKDEKKVDIEVFSQVDEMPAFPGGDNALRKYLAENVKYPETAFRDSIQGRVVVRFVVSDSGKIKNAKILLSLHPNCDAEAIRVIEAMPAWKPGKNKGIPANVEYTVPIVFRLSRQVTINFGSNER
jgi:TonB family protein